MTKYLPVGNEDRLKKVYDDRDPRLTASVITPYSTYVGANGSTPYTYTLRWPYRGFNTAAPFDVKSDTNTMFYYLWRKWVYKGASETPTIVYHNLHWNGYGANHKSTGKQVPLATLADGYHTFGLEWTKDVYVFYVDGKETWRSTSAVSQRNEYLILSTELTGWGGDPALGNFPDEVIFDYVRVYKPK